MISGETHLALSLAASVDQEETGPLRRDGMTYAPKVSTDY